MIFECEKWSGRTRNVEADYFVIEGVSQHGMAVRFVKDNRLVVVLTAIQEIRPVGEPTPKLVGPGRAPDLNRPPPNPVPESRGWKVRKWR